MEVKRQLETQMALQQKTKELLNAAEVEVNNLRLQQGSSEARHTMSSTSTPIIRGRHKLLPITKCTAEFIQYIYDLLAIVTLAFFLSPSEIKSLFNSLHIYSNRGK